jgi:glutamate synthase (NADPH) small chain
MPNMSPVKIAMPEQPADVRNKNFREVTLGYTAEMAIEEATRCLNCKHKPCIAGCPVNVKIPEFIQLVIAGKFDGGQRRKSARPTPCPPSADVSARRRPNARRSACAASRASRSASAVWSALWRTGDGRITMETPKPLPATARRSPSSAAVPRGHLRGRPRKLGYEVTIFEAFHMPAACWFTAFPNSVCPRQLVQGRNRIPCGRWV